MGKYYKILIFFVAIFAISSLLVLSRGRVKSLNENKAKNTPPPVDMEKLRREYSDNVGKVMAEFEENAVKIENASSAPDFLGGGVATSAAREFSASLPSLENLESFKGSVEGLRAPGSEYKDLHLNLMLSAVAMEGYVKSLFQEDRSQALELIKKVRESYEKVKSL